MKRKFTIDLPRLVCRYENYPEYWRPQTYKLVEDHFFQGREAEGEDIRFRLRLAYRRSEECTAATIAQDR